MHATPAVVDIANDVLGMAIGAWSGAGFARGRLRRAPWLLFSTIPRLPAGRVVSATAHCRALRQWPARHRRRQLRGCTSDGKHADGILRDGEVFGVAPLPVSTVEPRAGRAPLRWRASVTTPRMASIDPRRTGGDAGLHACGRR